MVPSLPTALKTGDIVDLPGIKFRFERVRASTPVKHYPLPEGPNLSTLMQGQTSVSVASEPAPKKSPKYTSREETPLAKLASTSVQAPRDIAQSEPQKSAKRAYRRDSLPEAVEPPPAITKQAPAPRSKEQAPKPSLLPPSSTIGSTKDQPKTRSGSKSKSVLDKKTPARGVPLREGLKSVPLPDRKTPTKALPLRDRSPVRPPSTPSKRSPKNGKDAPTDNIGPKAVPVAPTQAKAKRRATNSSQNSADPAVGAPSPAPPQYYLGIAAYQQHFDLALASLQAWPQFGKSQSKSKSKSKS